jgi:hypothetical protein
MFILDAVFRTGIRQFSHFSSQPASQGFQNFKINLLPCSVGFEQQILVKKSTVLLLRVDCSNLSTGFSKFETISNL